MNDTNELKHNLSNIEVLSQLNQRIATEGMRLQAFSSDVNRRYRLYSLFKELQLLSKTAKDTDREKLLHDVAIIEGRVEDIATLTRIDVKDQYIEPENQKAQLAKLIISQGSLVKSLQQSREEKQQDYNKALERLKSVSIIDGKLVLPVDETIMLARKSFQEAGAVCAELDEAIHVATFFGQDVFEATKLKQ